MLLEIITPKGLLVKEITELVEAKSALGEIGILPGHVRYLTLLDVGEIRYMKEGSLIHVSASEGFLEVVDDRVTCLLDEG